MIIINSLLEWWYKGDSLTRAVMDTIDKMSEDMRSSFLSKKTLDDKADLIFNENLQLQKASYKDSMKSAIKSTLKRVARIDETLTIAKLIIHAEISEQYITNGQLTNDQLANECTSNPRFKYLSANQHIRYDKILYILKHRTEIKKILKKNHIIVTNWKEDTLKASVVWTSDSELNSIVKPLLKDIERRVNPFASLPEGVKKAYPSYLLNRAKLSDVVLAEGLWIYMEKVDIKTLDKVLIEDVIRNFLDKFSADDQEFLFEEIEDFIKNQSIFDKSIDGWEKEITNQTDLFAKGKSTINQFIKAVKENNIFQKLEIITKKIKKEHPALLQKFNKAEMNLLHGLGHFLGSSNNFSVKSEIFFT